MDDLRIDGERLNQRLMTMAEIGKTVKGGVCRVALTEEDRKGRDLFVQWCEELGCQITIDEMGNIFARRTGRNNDLEPVLMGSHLDSQPTGGKYDGVLGVLAGLEVFETLNEQNIITERPLELVSWTNEEGARFQPAMISSGVFGGAFDLDFAYNQKDAEGIRLEDALEEIGYKGTHREAVQYKASLELHIEQGPVLEAENKTIGVVTGVQGVRWYELEITGKEAHAGPTPMQMRQDPVQTMAKILSDLYQGLPTDNHARLTIGRIETKPGVINTVAGVVSLSIDIRHPEAAQLDRMDQLMKFYLGKLKADGTALNLKEVWHSPPLAFAPECVAAVSEAAERLNLSHEYITSGAGHDAVYVARVAPTSMIFIPCKDGLSHNELEYASPEHIEAGANVLLQAVLKLSNE